MSRKSFLVLGLGSIFMIVGLVGCSSAPKVTRTEIDKPIDLSGKWNDTDSRLVAEEMIKDCLGRPWLNKFDEMNHRTPVIIIGTIINRSSEHINSQLFIKDLEKNLLNSGKVIFVANRQERQDIRDEREDQQSGNTDPSTIKPKGKETGSDFMIQGSVNSVTDQIKGKYAVMYQVDLELIDLTTNQKVWIGQKQIKKSVTNVKYSL